MGASIAVAGLAAACGTERIKVAQTSPLHPAAVLFAQRCGGCHTLGYAATHGSAPNARTAQANNGPNFDVRCERPVDRVLYAIENGGFSGAYMPQNVVTGQDAINVAKFVATYAGTQTPHTTGLVPCSSKPIGTLPPPTATIAAPPTSTTSSSTSSSSPASAKKKKPAHRRKKHR